MSPLISGVAGTGDQTGSKALPFASCDGVRAEGAGASSRIFREQLAVFYRRALAWPFGAGFALPDGSVRTLLRQQHVSVLFLFPLPRSR